MIKNLLIVLLLSSFVACNNQKIDTTPKEIANPVKYIKYYVRYLEAGLELQLEAKYHNDSTTIAMPEGVFVGESKINAKELPRDGWVHRQISRGTKPDSAYIFRYNISPTLEKQDTIYLPIYADFELATPTISKKTGGLLAWKGKSLQQSEGLVLIFEDSEGNNFTHTHRGITQGAQFAIRPNLIETLSKGKAILRIVHKRETRSTTAKQQILKQSEYYRKPIEFEIVD
jgi:hypothetical protein